MDKLKAKFIAAGYNPQIVEEHTEKLVQESLDDDGYLLPPHLKFPDIPKNSIGWRMGPGEDYMILLTYWFECLPKEESLLYKKKYPRI